jgi:hypothetical protein
MWVTLVYTFSRTLSSSPPMAICPPSLPPNTSLPRPIVSPSSRMRRSVKSIARNYEQMPGIGCPPPRAIPEA